MSGSCRIDKPCSVRAGVQNLLDTDPRSSNQACDFLSTFDPTYAGPRSRGGFVSLGSALR